MSRVNIKGIDKSELLAALYNNAKQQGMGFLNPQGAVKMTKEEAQGLIERSAKLHFVYLKGRALKVGLGKDDMCTDHYDRDNGQGAAERVVNSLIQNHIA